MTSAAAAAREKLARLAPGGQKIKMVGEPFKRVHGLWVKELRVLSKDKFALIIIFLLPVALILTIVSQGDELGGAVAARSGGGGGGGGDAGGVGRSNLELPRIGLIDLDDSEGFIGRDISQEMVDLFLDYAENRSAMRLYLTSNVSELDELMGRGSLNAYVVIPQQFEFNLSVHFPGFVEVHIDTLDVTGLQASQSVIAALVDEFKQTNGFTGVFNLSMIEANVPETGKGLFQVSPFFFPFVLFAIGALTSAQSIVSDVPKDRMVLTPASKFEVTMAKFLANQTLMSMLIAIMITMSVGFGLRIRGDYASYFFFLFLIAANGVLMGLTLSSFASTPLAALQLYIFMFLFQTIIVLFVPNEEVLQWIPVHVGAKVLTNVTLRGEPMSWYANYIGYMLVEAFILFFLTYVRFEKRRGLL
ncbi:MAG: hypothetical protein Kow0069_20730 [Promethearchaeota archaeon]